MIEEETNTNTSTEGSTNEQHKEKNMNMAIIAYILFFVPLLTDAKNDPFVKYHVKQGLVLFICFIIVAAISQTFFTMFIASLLNLGLIALAVIGILNVTKGKKKPLPLLGQFADKIHL
ncbi:MAG: hypothetical protein UY07_C0038G0014 [Parcubacteria group bacterium GW2011_GWA1_47_8]|nr:MAG: hypothetical protein UY07_C0038G0014 [Parcubacteria group bacterium GW2011_GWA1_47_8]KKW07522.1 MAG: hypothetical protein UY42_C0011G0001 [Parcubacteria group bacterium GW2011_GWA2_49_16]